MNKNSLDDPFTKMHEEEQCVCVPVEDLRGSPDEHWVEGKERQSVLVGVAVVGDVQEVLKGNERR